MPCLTLLMSFPHSPPGFNPLPLLPLRKLKIPMLSPTTYHDAIPHSPSLAVCSRWSTTDPARVTCGPIGPGFALLAPGGWQ